jgi:HSP20 family protein
MFYDFDVLSSFFKGGIEIDVMGDTKKIIIEADVPGYTEKDIEVKVEDNVLILSGKIERENDKTLKLLHMERNNKSSFYRSFVLPKNTNAEKIQAEFKSGVLKITIPKETKETKFIKIKT